ncbi:MAG: CotH kinase family protein [Prevotella sp.]|nr:CotH kinase family protein [Prevotella sp.]
MKRLFTAVIILAMTTMPANAQQHLIINELMQSNVECVRDDLNEFPDSWVELYNPTSEAINLGNYKIGTKDKANKAWQLPSNITVSAGGYVIIYCDKEENGLHTDFRLDSDKEGGSLYLFEGSTIVSSVVGIPVMPAPDIAYGRDASGNWGYELTSTPRAENTGGVVAADHILGAPDFDVTGQVFEGSSSFELHLLKPDGAPEGTVIRYTEDGSEPTATSTLYDDHIDITGTKVIRAKLFCDGWLSPVSTAQSYIFHPRGVTVPIISIQTKGEYIYDNAFGIYPNNTSKDNQVDWRRPINIEMFDAAGKASVINQLGETRIMGGQSRENVLKSMAIYTNKRFDPDPNKKRFSYEFFPDQKPGIDQFKSFALRDGGNDFEYLYFRDLIIQRTMGQNTDMDWQAGHTAVLYINGVYKGMLNIRERSNADYIYSNYNGLEDIDMIEISHEQEKPNWWTTVDKYIEELKEGTMEENYNAFKDFYTNIEDGDHSKEKWEEWMDVSEYLNIVIMNLFYANLDFPGNNIVFWRPNNKDTKSGLPKRWRFIAKDTDFGLGLYNRSNNHNTIDMLYNPRNYGDNWAFTEPATCLIKNMLENEDIRNLFIDKCSVFMGDFLNGNGTGDMIDIVKNEALAEFVAHRKENRSTKGINTEQEIKNAFENARTWAQGRPNNFYGFIRQKWGLGTAIPVTINKEMTEALPDEVLVNGIKLTKGVFDGKLFLNREITLEGNTNFENDKIVTGWEIKKTTDGIEETEYVDGSTYTFTVPQCTSLKINARMGDDPAPKLAISQYGAVSFSSTYPLDFTDQPVQAYIVTEDKGSSFAKQQVYKVPAETGLVVEGAEGTYKIPIAKTTSFDDVSSNMLLSTATADFHVPDDGKGYYGLFYSFNTNQLGFKKKQAGESFAIGKSYMCLTGQLAREISEIFFNDATAIPRVDSDAWTDGKAYNLNGQRVEKNYKGVMIVNGKKVFNNPK